MAHVATHIAPVSFSEKFAEFVKTKREAYAQYKLYRKTAAELSALDDRELADLGLTRGNIEMIAYHAVYGA